MNTSILIVLCAVVASILAAPAVDQVTGSPSQGCSADGKQIAVGETYQDSTTVYQCSSGGQLEVTGCVKGGEVVKIGELLAKSDGAAYSCQKGDGVSKLTRDGCVKGGKHYKAGDKVIEGDQILNCTQWGSIKLVGCYVDGKSLNEDELYEKNGVNLQCQIDNGKSAMKATACVQNSGGSKINRKLGCHFTDGSGAQQYEVECQYNAAAGTAVFQKINCNYLVAGGAYVILPDCSRKVSDSQVVACVKQGTDLVYKEYNGADAEKQASSAGHKSC